MSDKHLLSELEDGLYSIYKRSDTLKADTRICRITSIPNSDIKTISIFDKETNSFIKLEKVGEDSILEKITFDDIS